MVREGEAVQNSPGRSGRRCLAGVVTAAAAGLGACRRDLARRAGTACQVPTTSGAQAGCFHVGNWFRSYYLKVKTEVLCQYFVFLAQRKKQVIEHLFNDLLW